MTRTMPTANYVCPDQSLDICECQQQGELTSQHALRAHSFRINSGLDLEQGQQTHRAVSTPLNIPTASRTRLISRNQAKAKAHTHTGPTAKRTKEQSTGQSKSISPWQQPLPRRRQQEGRPRHRGDALQQRPPGNQESSFQLYCNQIQRTVCPP